MFKSILKKVKEDPSVLNTDSFDKRRFDRIYNMSKGIQNIEKVEEIPLFKELLGDIWASLYKMNPELKDETEISEYLQINKQIIQRMMNEESHQEYRENTRLDDLLSAVGTVKFGQETQKWIHEQLQANKELRNQIQQINELQRKVNQKQKKQKNNAENNSKENQNENGDGQQQGSQSSNGNVESELKQAMSAFANLLNQSLNANGESFSAAMKKAVKETKEAKKSLDSLFGGIQAGSGQGELEKIPLRDKLDLAEKLSNDKKIKEVANWAGRFTQIAKTKQKMKHKESKEQSGVEVGNELERLLPSELLQYTHEKTKKEFLRKYSEGETLQYEQKGKESLGKGSIILCIDQSGSMCKLECQSKGFALALIAIAKKQKRNFAYIPFDTVVNNVEQFAKGKILPNDMVRIARNFLGGGTEFFPPLKKSLEIIQKDKFRDADIIFITDGHANISKSFLKQYHELKQKKQFNVLSLVIGNDSNINTVQSFSDKVINISNFNDEGSFEAFEI